MRAIESGKGRCVPRGGGMLLACLALATCGGAREGVRATSGAVEQRSGLALAASQSMDARLLILSSGGGEGALAAIRHELDFSGTPYTLVDLATASFAATPLSDGANHGFFQGVLVTSSRLIPHDGVATSGGMKLEDWNALVAYMKAFNVRMVYLFTSPDQVEGYAAGGASVDTSATPLTLTATQSGAAVFAYAASPVPIQGVGVYVAAPADAQTEALLVDAAGNAPVALRKLADGREAMYLTFDQGPTAVHSLQLLHGAVAWVTRGLFVGQKCAYMNPQLDDMFLGNIQTTGAAYRITGDELTAAVMWQRAVRATPSGAGFRLAFAFNGSGASDADAQTQAARKLGQEVFWVSHTFSHLNLNSASYDATLTDLRANDDFMKKLALGSYDPANLVPPSMSGLWNADALRAMKDFGIQRLICDTSRPGCEKTAPNVGVPSPDQPTILMVPRRPNALFAYVSTPAEWVSLYNTRYRSVWGRDLTVEEIIDEQSNTLAGYVLRGEVLPWMFHQGNLRLYDSQHALLSDLLSRTMEKVARVLALPITSISMTDIGTRLQEHMQRDTAGTVVTVGPGAQVTLTATQAAKVAVTGLSSSNAENCGDGVVSHVDIPAGGAITLPLEPVSQATSGVDAGDPTDSGAVGASAGGGGGGCLAGGEARAIGAMPLLVVAAALAFRLRRRRVW